MPSAIRSVRATYERRRLQLLRMIGTWPQESTREPETPMRLTSDIPEWTSPTLGGSDGAES